MTELNFRVNGNRVRGEVDPDQTLLAYLRDQGLTGTKNGCSQGRCGSCTVLINDQAIKSCTVKLGSEKLDGAEVTTIEGVAGDDGRLHPLQAAFVDAGALQCGFCTPGMVLSGLALVRQNPDPTEAQVREFLAVVPNICRCTGYQKIVEAILDGAARMRGEGSSLAGSPNDAPLLKTEARLKVTGELEYADDITPENVLYGAVLFAPQAPARVVKVETGPAESMPGVAGVITAAEMRGTNRFGIIDRDQEAIIPVGGLIKSVSDVLAGVFAETPDQAKAAVKAIEIELEPLPGVYSCEEAKAEGAPLVHPEKETNLFYEGRLIRGDVEADLEAADLVVSGVFTTSRVVHGFLEPESGLAEPDGRGGVIIRYPSQTVFDDQAQLSECLGLDLDQVRVIQLPTGGAFGGKADIIFHQLLAAGALKFDRPTKITLSRPENLKYSQKKHGVTIDCTLGLTQEGEFTALKARAELDKGAYANLGLDIAENVMDFIGGPYFIPAVEIEAKSWFTNNIQAGAMRGFGANQANFVIESLVDEAARELELDPFQIRLANVLLPGLPTVSDHVLEPGLASAEDCLLTGWSALTGIEPPEADEGWELGFGLACGVKNVGFGHGLPESAGAEVELTEDGRAILSVSHHDYGQGASIGQARIAARALEIPLELVQVLTPDTGITPYTGPSTASKQTVMSGNATLGACRQLFSQVMVAAGARLGVRDVAALRLQGSEIVLPGTDQAVPLAALHPDRRKAAFRAIMPRTSGFREDGQVSDYHQDSFQNRRTHWCYANGAQAVWVQVRPETGEVKVLKILAIGDVGHVLNQRAVEGQHEGGAVMGVGYALSEQIGSREGRVTTGSFGRLGLTKADMAPPVTTVPVQVPHPWGPLGAKGFAEGPSLATAPAIANAIADATGARLTDLPMTPDRVKKAIEEISG